MLLLCPPLSKLLPERATMPDPNSGPVFILFCSFIILFCSVLRRLSPALRFVLQLVWFATFRTSLHNAFEVYYSLSNYDANRFVLDAVVRCARWHRDVNTG
mmetsp:Transcript_21285/g.43795  ORF Transcript_21285/g.43795 Transcript_21285/m.43795 type:complete len:101 (+) Transcript_21285:471-773(+)